MRKRHRHDHLTRLLRNASAAVPELPEEIVGVGESTRELIQTIQSLKPDYRAVVVLRGIQGLSAVEAAQILQCSQNKVNVMFHRAIKLLHDKLSQAGW